MVTFGPKGWFPKNMESSFVPDSIYISIGCLIIPNTIQSFFHCRLYRA